MARLGRGQPNRPIVVSSPPPDVATGFRAVATRSPVSAEATRTLPVTTSTRTTFTRTGGG